MHARIYRPAKPATSSGRFKSRQWILEFEPQSRQEADRLIGWIGRGETDRQITLRFASKDEAIGYCEKRQITFTVYEPHQRVVKPKSYAENFIRRV